MLIIIHSTDCTVIYQCNVQIIFSLKLKREKGVKRENMSVTCKDLIEYVLEQQKVIPLRSISFLERDVTYHSTKHMCSYPLRRTFWQVEQKIRKIRFLVLIHAKYFDVILAQNLLSLKYFNLLGIFRSYFYRTRVRSLAMLVTH